MSSRLKTALCIVVPVVIIGLLAWKIKEEDDSKVNEKSMPEPPKAVNETTAAEEPPASAAAEKDLVESATASQPAPPKPRIEIKPSPGRGRGLFLADREGQGAVAAGQVVALVRPALTLLFEPFCYTHCLGCFADLHAVPGRRCSDCERFAVCQQCDQDYGLFEWHAGGECRRWQTLPPKIRQQKRLDALWLLVRYRAALDADADFTDVSEAASAAASGAASLEAALRAAAAAQDACAGGAGGKEPVRSLDDLQGNEVAPELLPVAQLAGFAQLADLAPHTVRALVLRLRTNAGAIHFPAQNGGATAAEASAQAGCALSSTLSALNHSCAPNAAATVQRGWLVVASLQPLAPGDELTICYVDAERPGAERRAVLREHYNFECSCARCRRELEEEALDDASAVSGVR